jgi:hypothetical protein
LFEHLLSKKKLPEEHMSAWIKLNDVKIEGATLTLSFQ